MNGFNKGTAALIRFGRGGYTIYYRQCHGTRTEGYDLPEHYDASELPDGCLAMDTRPAIETEEGFRYVFSSPLVDVDLEDDAVDRLDTTHSMVADHMLNDTNNRFGLIMALHRAHTGPEPGPLDSVSLRRYVEGWKQHGARTGRTVNGKIEWEE